jgi:DNA adenine methylase
VRQISLAISGDNGNGVVNVASVAHRSPFRYPGGKTWLVPTIRQWLQQSNPRPRELAEPFAGGGIVSLSSLFDNLVGKIVLVEMDDDVAAVWKTIVYGDGIRLAREILNFDIKLESVKAVLAKTPRNEFERAFSTIVRNRVQRGGILAPGASLLNKGENGKGIRSRWYPNTLRRRIEAIVHTREDISFVHGDGIEFIRYNGYRRDTAFFIDPPYTVAGKRLYRHSEMDHEELFRVCGEIKGDFLMTYDNTADIRDLARRAGFETALVPMKNTHHEIMHELIVGKHLAWLRSPRYSV